MTSSGTVLVGTTDGLYESKNGGASFTQILPYNVTGLDAIGDAAYILTDRKDGDKSEVKIWKYGNDGLSLISELTGDNVNLINLEWQNFYVKEGKDKQFLITFRRQFIKFSRLKSAPQSPTV